MTSPTARPDILTPIVGRAGLTPRDTYFVDLSEVLEQADLDRPDREDILARLAVRRADAGDDYLYLVNNPTSAEVLPDQPGWRHLTIQFWRSGAYRPSTILVDVPNMQVLWNYDFDVISFPEDAQLLTISDVQSASVMEEVRSHVENWLPSEETDGVAISSWKIAATHHDFSLFRISSHTYGLPSDFQDLINEVSSILGLEVPGAK